MRLLDFALRGAGAVLAIFLGGASAVLEAVYTPYRIGGWPAVWLVPVAFGVGVFLDWFARTATGAAWGWWLPAVPWFLIMIFAVGGTQEGDQIASTWLGLLVLAAGGIGFVGPAAFRAGRRTTAPRPRAAAPQLTHQP
ncbi:hypothetical protein Cme02nite_42800 [Catellatospora methionotrophica]|uniref:Uncharacterized protein n=1 Tax=Catellatospora methionotrophica TaxID=121620 RepID=A0A8J3PH23_9ACTN|nr:hypothetical protein [Catellatospora methionotrophica]GIG15948.1 hypothetical protein Cme02nite_42800 [Catellatospora methionotrophica]